MVKRISKRTVFILSLLAVGAFGLIQNILKDNFTKSGSSFYKEKISITPEVLQDASADYVIPPATGDGDGSGDGSNGF